MAQRPIAEGLFTQEPALHLIGGRRKTDGRITFPLPTGPEAGNYEPVSLKSQGTLWSFTIQRFRPKSPPYAGADDERTFTPFALGYVELAGEVIVESRIATDDLTGLRIGQAMRLVLAPFGKDADGTAVVTFAFEPIADFSARAAA